MKKDRSAGKMTPVFLKSGYVLVVPDAGHAAEDGAQESEPTEEKQDTAIDGGNEGHA